MAIKRQTYAMAGKSYRPPGKLARCRQCGRMFRAYGTWTDRAGCCSANCRTLRERDADAG